MRRKPYIERGSMNKIMTQSDEAIWLSDEKKNMANELDVKETEYTEYVNKHIKTVQAIWEYIQPLLTGKYWLEETFLGVVDRAIKEHDKSKFSNDEFNAYRQWFYPTEKELVEQDFRHSEFMKAWNHHQNLNKHHWEYWVFICDCDKTTALEMPLGAILEMLCDWTAMSLKNGNKPSDWFFSNRFKMKLHEKNVETINLWLPIFDVAYMQMKG
jgi:hypothetical protein